MALWQKCISGDRPRALSPSGCPRPGRRGFESTRPDCVAQDRAPRPPLRCLPATMSPRSTLVIRAKGSDSGASPRSQSHRCLSEGTAASPSTLSPRSPRVLAESPGRSPTCSRLPWIPAPFDPAAVCQSMRRGSSSQRRTRVSLSSSPTRRLSRTLPGCTDAIIWSDASHAIGKLSNNRRTPQLQDHRARMHLLSPSKRRRSNFRDWASAAVKPYAVVNA